MSGDDETVIVMTNGRVYHTDETCRCITDRAREWDLDEVAPTELDRERASVSLAWFVAVWLAIMAASTFTGVMLYFAGVGGL